MRLPLDTQIVIWAVSADRRVRRKTRAFFENGENEALVSAVSIWEIAIKYPLLERRDAPPFSGAAAMSGLHACVVAA